MTERETRDTQKKRILRALWPGEPVTNLQLNEICFRYGARIGELRQEGWDIRSKKISSQVWEYTCKGRK